MPASEPSPSPAPPHRHYRLADGRTYGWGGPTWQGHWRYGDAVIAAAPVDGWDLGQPLGDDGRKLDGGFVTDPAARSGPPSDAVPSDAQFAILGDLPNSEAGVRGFNGNKQRTLLSLDRAGWVFWSGPGGWAYLHTTTAGREAIARYRLARDRKRARTNYARRRGAFRD